MHFHFGEGRDFPPFVCTAVEEVAAFNRQQNEQRCPRRLPSSPPPPKGVGNRVCDWPFSPPLSSLQSVRKEGGRGKKGGGKGRRETSHLPTREGDWPTEEGGRKSILHAWRMQGKGERKRQAVLGVSAEEALLLHYTS